MPDSEVVRRATRGWIVRAFGLMEDVTYVGLGLLLGAMVLALLATTVVGIGHSVLVGTLVEQFTPLLDRVLLTLLTVELLYTVQVSFREHALIPEPFLLVGLIAAIRRVLVLTAEYGELHGKSAEMVHNYAIELAVLTVLIVALVGSLLALRKAGSSIRVDRA